jgi:flagellar biosynthesis protein FlhB
MAEELGERTELPSARKRSEARMQGQVARSPLFSSAFGLVVAAVLIVVFGSSLTQGLAAILRSLLDPATTGPAISPTDVQQSISWVAAHSAVLLAPILAIIFLFILITEISQVGWAPSIQPLQPKLERLNPIAGVGKLVSRRNVVRTTIAAIKLSVLCLVTVIIVTSEWENIVHLARLDLRPLIAEVLRILYRVMVWLLAVLITIAFADLVYQRWQLTQDLRMTKQDVKEEQKMMEGDMEMKGRRLRAARQIALQRLQGSVPKADVVVTNPTHFAVALKYEPGMDAPKVVAKGADFLAFRIREIAAANNVPIVERPPLARALYASAPVGKQIKPEFYEAVAEILAYVYRINGKAA